MNFIGEPVFSEKDQYIKDLKKYFGKYEDLEYMVNITDDDETEAEIFDKLKDLQRKMIHHIEILKSSSISFDQNESYLLDIIDLKLEDQLMIN
jgi:hypothetical protein